MQALLQNLGESLGLRRLDAPVSEGVRHSRFIALLTNPVLALRQKLRPWAQGSLAVKWLPGLSFTMVLLLLLTLPFAESEKSGILVLAAALVSLLRLLLLDEELPFSSLTGLVLIFAAMGLVATAASDFPLLSLYGLGKLLVYLATYFCFLINLRTISQIRISAWVIVAGAIAVSLYGLYQWQIKVPPLALWDDPESEYKLTRVYSFLGNPNLLAGYLLPTMSLTAFFYFGNLGWRKFVLLGAFALQLPCLYFTYCRGAWIALVLGGAVAFVCCLLIFWHIFAKNAVFRGLLFGGVILGAIGAVAFVMRSPELQERIRSLVSGGQHSSNNFRINVWHSSLDIIKGYALTGIGLGSKTFIKVYSYYMATGFKALSTYNVLLEVWLEMGLFGLISFVAMLLAHFGRCLWGIVQEIDYSARLFLAAALTAITGLMVHGMVDTVFYRPPIQILFWYLLAIITVVTQDGIAFRNQSPVSGGPEPGPAAK
ncbi:MAG: O-antigen ligase family protein [Candidatus Sericytochromatia bacterium]